MVEYHEPNEYLNEETRNWHRAIQSLIEELDAVTWYQQRATATKDEPLRQILAHNRDEEIKHAAMLLEWLRRKMPGWDGVLQSYLFTKGPITEIEEKIEKRSGGRPDLGIGSMRPREEARAS